MAKEDYLFQLKILRSNAEFNYFLNIEFFSELLRKHYIPSTDQNEIFEKLTEYCGKSVHFTKNELDNYQWDFYNSFYFAYTVVSTIGTYRSKYLD